MAKSESCDSNCSLLKLSLSDLITYNSRDSSSRDSVSTNSISTCSCAAETAHARSHARSDEWLENRKSAWQKQCTGNTRDQTQTMQLAVDQLNAKDINSARKCVLNELACEQHIVRQLTGRRVGSLSPVNYRPTLSPERPVAVEGGWQTPNICEQFRHYNVQVLQNQLFELRRRAIEMSPKHKPMNIVRRLHAKHNIKRVFVYGRGKLVDRVEEIYGESVDELLYRASEALRMDKPAKHLFTVAGDLVVNFESISSDEILCASACLPWTNCFIHPLDSHQAVEIKARWARARRLYGHHVTDHVQPLTSNKLNIYVEAPRVGEVKRWF